VRLIVTDNATSARTIADRLAQGNARGVSVHRVDVFAVEETESTRVIGLGGLLFTPTGDPPQWAPARRAPANALRVLARSATSLILATDDPLLATQARDVACEGRPHLLRAARVGHAPFTVLRHVDDQHGQAAAAHLEIEAVVAAYMARLDPELRLADLAALGIAGPGPVSHAVLHAAGVAEASLARLAERGYLVDDPAWRTPAGDLVTEAVDRALLDPGMSASCTAWIDAVGRGTLPRAAALDRARSLFTAMRRPDPVEEIVGGRVIGPCPECGESMAGARGRLTCMGCGHWYRIPRNVEVLAVPGSRCPACDAPLILPVVHGRRDEPRCPDTTGCPTRLRVRVGT
jgi:hypothetical protein